MSLLDRLSPKKLDTLRRYCAGERTEQIAAETGLAPSSVVSRRNMILDRMPKGMTLRDVCITAAEEDPSFTVSPDIGKRKDTTVRTSR